MFFSFLNAIFMKYSYRIFDKWLFFPSGYKQVLVFFKYFIVFSFILSVLVYPVIIFNSICYLIFLINCLQMFFYLFNCKYILSLGFVFCGLFFLSFLWLFKFVSFPFKLCKTFFRVSLCNNLNECSKKVLSLHSIK